MKNVQIDNSVYIYNSDSLSYKEFYSSIMYKKKFLFVCLIHNQFFSGNFYFSSLVSIIYVQKLSSLSV